ncbi:alpha/beta hydrolase [Microseira wollei]|uniref:alpha/beta hydrolase n=1 Tax=Microseira wollei TaxID=467598 RepID=UPI001CFC676D|nr:alpha/beta hydrolase [Microseira wollei]
MTVTWIKAYSSLRGMEALVVADIVFTLTWFECAQFSHIAWWVLSLWAGEESKGYRYNKISQRCPNRQLYDWGERRNYYSCEIIMRSLLFFLRRALFFASTVAVCLNGTDAGAADRIVLKYGFLQNSISVRELSTLAETGKVSDSLETSLNRLQQNPQDIRRTLTQPVNVNPILLDRVLNSPAGDLILDQISQVVSTSSNRANRQALRSALVLSATRDGQISLIELIATVPTFLQGGEG